jgi:transposase InsO family protein
MPGWARCRRPDDRATDPSSAWRSSNSGRSAAGHWTRHVGATTVQRMIAADGPNAPVTSDQLSMVDRAGHTVSARARNDVWHVDLTVVPTRAGFWTMLRPFASLQRWPFGCWIAVTVDHFSRRAVGFAVVGQRPTAGEIPAFLGRVIRAAGTTPGCIVTDKGRQFWCRTFTVWCRRRRIRPRFGAVDKHGSIAIVERFIRSMKTDCCRRIVVPARMDRLREKLALYLGWYNGHRPHQGVGGRTPEEVSFHRRAAKTRPRYEPRQRWPRRNTCARPQAKVKGQRGVRLQAEIRHLEGRRHLPIVGLRPAA